MKYILSLLLLSLLAVTGARAQEKSEGALVARIAQTLITNDADGYAQLFPSAGLIAQTIVATAPADSREHAEMEGWQSSPQLMEMYNNRLDTFLQQSFRDLRAQGEELGIRWNAVRLSRYELVKASKTRDSLYEKLASERFLGYVFLNDPFLQKTFCFTVGDVVKIDNGWWGGYLTRIYPADTKEAFEQHAEAARKAAKAGKPYIVPGVKKADDDNNEGENSPENLPAAAGGTRKVVAERRFYRGMFDGEIPVQLYVRGLRGSCSEGVCAWEAAFKFGDQDDWSLMSVSRTGGKWVFSELDGEGVLDLELKSGALSGSWTDGNNKTGYEAVLKEEPPAPKKAKGLDALLDGD